MSLVPGRVFASLSSLITEGRQQSVFPFIEHILGRALLTELVCCAFETWF